MQIEPESIAQMCISAEEDVLYYVDRNNQLLKTELILDDPEAEPGRSEYVQGPFHNEQITGMDICLRK